MHCTKCDNHLSKCTCVDLEETLNALEKSEHIMIHPQVMAVYRAQAKRNKEKAVEDAKKN